MCKCCNSCGTEGCCDFCCECEGCYNSTWFQDRYRNCKLEGWKEDWELPKLIKCSELNKDYSDIGERVVDKSGALVAYCV